MADFETEDMLEQERQKFINQWPDDDEEEEKEQPLHTPPKEKTVGDIQPVYPPAGQ